LQVKSKEDGRGNLTTAETTDLYSKPGVATRKRIIVGAEGTSAAGWISTEAKLLNLLAPSDWASLYEPESLDAILAEHVWEHLSFKEGLIAAKTCMKFLKSGGCVRVAVPDGLHPNPDYIQWVKVDGKGPGAADHRVLYTYKTLRKVFEDAGFRVVLLEYYDEEGYFHFKNWDPKDGMIRRSRRFDDRNQNGSLNYTSIIMDAFKEPNRDVGQADYPPEELGGQFSPWTALPNFGPLAPTENSLHLLDSLQGIKALEIGCGNGYSLRYLAQRGAAEIWGLDRSASQIAEAHEVLTEYRDRIHLFRAPMETNPGIPASYFDLILSIYALGFTSELAATLGLIARYLKPGGALIVSDEHPVFSCLTLKNELLVFDEAYTLEDAHEKEEETALQS